MVEKRGWSGTSEAAAVAPACLTPNEMSIRATPAAITPAYAIAAQLIGLALVACASMAAGDGWVVNAETRTHMAMGAMPHVRAHADTVHDGSTAKIGFCRIRKAATRAIQKQAEITASQFRCESSAAAASSASASRRVTRRTSIRRSW